MSDLGNKEIFSKNLKHYIYISGKDRQDICNDLGIKYSTLSEWINASKYPRIDKIELLANYFNIEKSDLIEEKHEKYHLDNDIRRIQRAREKMPEKEKQKMMKMITTYFDEYFSDDDGDEDIDE